MNFIKQNWFRISVVFLVLVIACFLFYWFEWRSAKIRQGCFKISQAPSQDITDNNYKNCLRNSGLEK